MPAHGRIPASRLDVLPRGTPLQVEFAARVENMQVHDRVQQHRAAVTLAARGPADDAPREVDHREKFFAVVAVHRIEIGKSLCKDNTKQPNHGKTEPLFYRTRDRYRCFAAGSGRKTVTKRETGNEAEDRRTRGRRWRQGPETRRGRWKGKIHPPPPFARRRSPDQAFTAENSGATGQKPGPQHALSRDKLLHLRKGAVGGRSCGKDRQRTGPDSRGCPTS